MSIYSTIAMQAMAATLFDPPSFVLDNFFPTEQVEETEVISFDIEIGARKVSPFVHPLVPGKVVQDRGTKTESLKPAYIKDLRLLRPNETIRRKAGEQVGGSMSRRERAAQLLNQKMQDQRDMWKRRLELMAAQTLLTGSLTITGEEYPTVVLDYGRDSDNTVSLVSGARWSQATADPEADFETWEQKLLKKSNKGATKVMMTNDAWALFRANAKVEKRLDLRRVNQANMTMTLSQKKEGGIYMGNLGSFEIYTYRGWYVNDAGAEVSILPDYTVVMVGDAYEGVRAFGAIEDLESLQATPLFWKSDSEFDPSAKKILMQSAPLTYPRYPNASITATVHS